MLFRLRFNRYTSYKAKSRPYYIKSLRSYTRMTETKLTPTFVDSHIHIDYVMEKLNVPLGDLDSFMHKHFYEASNGRWDGSVHVVCDVDRLNETNLKLIEHPKLVGAFGVHPHEAKHWNKDIENNLIGWMKHPKMRAWGETGLDYHYNMSDPAVQREVFEKQLQLAVASKKPIVVHSREAEEDTIKIMKDNVPSDWLVHVHCFTSSVDMATKLLAHFSNLYIGFTGVVTFKNADDVRKVVEVVPLNRMLLETDGPFMAPMPYRGKPATSGMIPHTAQKIAEIKKVTLDEVLVATRENTKVVYGI